MPILKQDLEKEQNNGRSTPTTSEDLPFFINLRDTRGETRPNSALGESVVVDTTLEERQAQSLVGPREDVDSSTEPIPDFVSEVVTNTECQRCKNSMSSSECCCRSIQGSRSQNWNLLYSNRELFKLKDFRSEVRASMDVEQFVHGAELMLDLTEISVDGIIEAMLRRIISDDKAIVEARKAIFVPGSSMLVAKTIQGVISQGQHSNTGSLSYDQSWLCAVCNLTQVNQRLMVISRFKQAVNFGENAHEIRLFMLIITPSKEKGTKNALETGRTFATMFTDASFRRKLLNSKSEVHFKSLMVLKTQQLSQAKSLKNRHKYKLDPAVHLSVRSLSLNRDSFGNENGFVNPQEVSSESNSSPSPSKPTSGPLAKLVTLNKVNNNDDIETDVDVDVDGPDKVIFNRNPRASKLFDLISSVGSTPLTTKQAVEMFQLRAELESSAIHQQLSQRGSFYNRLAHVCKNIEFGKGLWGDFIRRAVLYPTDFKDAFVGPPKTVQKSVATIWFLYFGILLPTIAFSALNTTQTDGLMGDLRKAIIGQAIGGLAFALLAGQPLVIIMTTAPLCLYTKVIHKMCTDYGFHFPAMYAMVGLWNGFFLLIYSMFGFSKLMKWCTRSTEEIFALFIVIAFITDAGKDMMKNFQKYYYAPACQAIDQSVLETANTLINYTEPLTSNLTTTAETIEESSYCRRETSLLFLMLMLGTLWLATTLYRFNKTPFLEANKRELLADYALPTAVIVMSFVGSFVFDEIQVESFPPLKKIRFEMAQLELLPTSGILTAAGLGFTLSLLFFMDQNISAAMVNAPQNRLKKGSAYHLDLLVVGVLNVFLTIFGLPMMHGVLPHSPLHVRSLADIEKRVEEGHESEVITNVRENRVTGVISHILILATLLLIPLPIAYIPRAVLNGLFLYMAVTSLEGLQIFERILLLVTEQSKYPPNHYIRRCPQRKIHQFTLLQLIQLAVMCLFGFSPINIVEMFFPVIILLMIPFRHSIVPRYIGEKYLKALDGKH